MLKTVFYLIPLLLTTFSISGLADTYRNRCLGFEQPPEYNFYILPDGPVWQGLEPATCADIDSAATQSTLPGEVWAQGSGSMRCFRGLGYLYGNPTRTPATAGVRGTVNMETFQMLFDQCLRNANLASPGCTFQSGVSSEFDQCEDPGFISLPAPEMTTAPLLNDGSSNPLAIGGIPIGCSSNLDCSKDMVCVQNVCSSSAPPTAPPPPAI